MTIGTIDGTPFGELGQVTRVTLEYVALQHQTHVQLLTLQTSCKEKANAFLYYVLLDQPSLGNFQRDSSS